MPACRTSDGPTKKSVTASHLQPSAHDIVGLSQPKQRLQPLEYSQDGEEEASSSSRERARSEAPGDKKAQVQQGLLATKDTTAKKGPNTKAPQN